MLWEEIQEVVLLKCLVVGVRLSYHNLIPREHLISQSMEVVQLPSLISRKMTLEQTEVSSKLSRKISEVGLLNVLLLRSRHYPTFLKKQIYT